MNSPPIVGENVENAQHHNKECGRPLGLETNGNHDTSGKTNDRNKNAHEAPFALKNEAKEKEDQEDSAGKEEAKTHCEPYDFWENKNMRTISCGRSH